MLDICHKYQEVINMIVQPQGRSVHVPKYRQLMTRKSKTDFEDLWRTQVLVGGGALHKLTVTSRWGVWIYTLSGFHLHALGDEHFQLVHQVHLFKLTVCTQILLIRMQPTVWPEVQWAPSAFNVPTQPAASRTLYDAIKSAPRLWEKKTDIQVMCTEPEDLALGFKWLRM